MNDYTKLFFSEESGQGMVEYGLIILLIAMVAVSAVNIFGLGVKDLYEQVNTKIT